MSVRDAIECSPQSDPTYCVIQKHTTFPILKLDFVRCLLEAGKSNFFLFTASNSLFNVLLQCKLFGATPALTVQQGRHHFSVTLNCHLNPVSHCWHSFSSGLFSSVLLLRFSFSLFCRDLIIFLRNLTCTWMGAIICLSPCINSG